MPILEQLVEYIGTVNLFQKKYLENVLKELTTEELNEFEILIYLYQQDGYDTAFLGDSYLKFIQDIIEEQLYFVESGQYRYKTLDEVDRLFYSNADYMEQYMIGLALSTYLLYSHRDYMRYFTQKIKGLSGAQLLEIGPGHGEYFVKAMQSTNFSKYVAVDISKTCVEFCNRFVKQHKALKSKDYEILQKDFFDYNADSKFDAIIMGEVLEHVEAPLAFLNKIYETAADNAFIYITTVINCPQKDHIYLFRCLDDIKDLFRKANLKISDLIQLPTNRYTLEKAIKDKLAINIAFVLKKTERGQ